VVAYLSTSDYVQHKNRPTDEGALEFYGAVDSLIGYLDALGITVGLTADHGMNDKVRGRTTLSSISVVGHVTHLLFPSARRRQPARCFP